MRALAIAVGIALASLGIAGFVPAWTPGGELFGVFAVDAPRNAFNFFTGIFGVGMGASGAAQAASYFRIAGAIFAVLTFAGLLVVHTGELMGMAHNQGDLLLQAGIAAFALVMGFVGPQPTIASRRAY